MIVLVYLGLDVEDRSKLVHVSVATSTSQDAVRSELVELAHTTAHYVVASRHSRVTSDNGKVLDWIGFD